MAQIAAGLRDALRLPWAGAYGQDIHPCPRATAGAVAGSGVASVPAVPPAAERQRMSRPALCQ